MIFIRAVKIVVFILLVLVIVALVTTFAYGVITGEIKPLATPSNQYCKLILTGFDKVNDAMIPKYAQDCITPVIR